MAERISPVQSRYPGRSLQMPTFHPIDTVFCGSLYAPGLLLMRNGATAGICTRHVAMVFTVPRLRCGVFGGARGNALLNDYPVVIEREKPADTTI